MWLRKPIRKTDYDDVGSFWGWGLFHLHDMKALQTQRHSVCPTFVRDEQISGFDCVYK